MSRFLKIMIVLLTIAAIAAPVMAEDRLGLSGQMRVRAWYVDNDNDSPDNTESWMDQRLRLGGKFSIAEGVSVTFRTDITESNWGTTGSGNGFGSGRSGANQQWDRAHLDLKKNNIHFRAGQQYIQFGQGATVNSQDNGLTFNFLGAIPVTVFWMIADDDASRTKADDYLYGAKVAHNTDVYSADFYVAGQTVDENNVDPLFPNGDSEVYAIGADLIYNLDAIKLAGELTIFTGDHDDTTDAMGTQLMLDASFAASEMATVGAQFFYALGADTDGSEVQYVVLGNDFGGWDPLFDVGTGLDNEQIGAGRPFDFTGDDAGVIAGRLYASVKASDDVKLGASFTYLVPEEDDILITDVDSAYALAGGLSYALMSNTKLDVQVEYIDVDAPGAEEVVQAGVGLFVNF